jgi:sulfatase maturation enzyme AslB (radical SAM superfamily)
MILPDDFNEPSKHSFCVLPWIHRFVNLGGEVQLCCTSEEHPQSFIKSDTGKPINFADGFSDKQISNSRHNREIRKSMLQGVWPAACERCMITEQCGGSSRRLAKNQHFRRHIPRILESTDEQGNAPVHIHSRDYRLGNLCNLRCRMCHPRASRILLEEWNQVSRRRLRLKGKSARQIEQMDWFQNEQLWKDFANHIHDLEHLHFAGGEPLVIPEVLKALEICVELGVASSIELTFNTNITKIPKKHQDLWPQFKAVNLLCSIDAFGELNDYIRHPSKWSTIERNLDLIDREHEKLNLGSATISATVQIYNIFRLSDLIEYSHQRFSFIRPMPILVHLSVPDYFNIQYLPDDLKELATRKLEDLREGLESIGVTDGFNQLDGILRFMHSANHSPYIMSEFRRITSAYDQLRNESVIGLVPELAVLMQPGGGESFDSKVKMVKSQAEWLAGRIKNKLLSRG